MCQLCKTKPVYEFTNKRKLCARCFVNYFQKKILYTLRKFKMIRQGDIIGYKKTKDFKGVVLENILKFISEKSGVEVVVLPDKRANKIASDSSADSEAEEIINVLIRGKIFQLNKELPVEKNVIKPLYLFLDEEILLYAKLLNLKFSNKEEKSTFIGEFEKKHPEVKRAIVNSLLKLEE